MAIHLYKWPLIAGKITKNIDYCVFRNVVTTARWFQIFSKQVKIEHFKTKQPFANNWFEKETHSVSAFTRSQQLSSVHFGDVDLGDTSNFPNH